MTLAEKIKALRQQEFAIFKWNAGSGRIAGDFILMSTLRLSTLTCRNGVLTFSSAAPVLMYKRKAPHIILSDTNVVTLGGGSGINKIRTYVKESDGPATQAICCGHWTFTEDDDIPAWISKRIMSLGCSMLYPTRDIVVPDIYRLTRDMDSITPAFTKDLVDAIGGTKTDTVEQLMQKFKANFHLFGCPAGEGYIIENDYVWSGGSCVVSSRGIRMKTGSVVHSIRPGNLLDALARRRWLVHNSFKEES